MNKIHKTFLMAIAILLGSCTYDPIQPQPENTNPENDKIENSYYVKFEGSYSHNVGNAPIFTMQAGERKYVVQSRNCSEILGPISKDEPIKFSVDDKVEISSYLSRKIYVCRNNEPFVLVAHTKGTNELTYTIDF